MSGVKAGARVYQQFKKQIEEKHMVSELFESRYRKHAVEIARTCNLQGFHALVLIGGDGLVHEVLNGLAKRLDWDHVNQVPIAIVPCGSGNAIASSLHIDSLDDVIHRIENGHVRFLDLARIQMGTTSILGCCVVSWGLHARIVRDSEHFRWLGNRRFWGSMLFNILFRQHFGLVELKDAHNLLREKETPTFEGRLGYFLVTKIHSLEKGFKIAPAASVDDRYLDVIIVKDQRRRLVLNFLLQVLSQKHLNLPYVSYWKAKSLVLTALSNTSPLCIDGEFYDIRVHEPVHVEIEPNLRLKVFM